MVRFGAKKVETSPPFLFHDILPATFVLFFFKFYNTLFSMLYFNQICGRWSKTFSVPPALAYF